MAVLKPCPIMGSPPITLSTGTRQSSKISSQVRLPRNPILCSMLPTLKPGVPFSSAKAVIPPRLLFDLSLTASTVEMLATSPFVMKCLSPLMTKWSPSRSAVVWTLPASEPASGSDRAKQAVHSPLAIRGRYFRFWSSVPSIRMPMEPMPLLVPTRDRKAALVLVNSS